jgi:hypothetical protein
MRKHQQKLDFKNEQARREQQIMHMVNQRRDTLLRNKSADLVPTRPNTMNSAVTLHNNVHRDNNEEEEGA